MNSEPKQVKLSERSFTANGVEYYISSTVSIDRWIRYEELEQEITFGTSFKTMYDNLLKAYNALNEKKFADAAVIIHNTMSGVKDAMSEDRVPPALEVCALLMNRKDEDVGVYDKNLMASKIEDWRKEGLDMLSFFAWALQSIKGFRETYIALMEKQVQKALKDQQNNL